MENASIFGFCGLGLLVHCGASAFPTLRHTRVLDWLLGLGCCWLPLLPLGCTDEWLFCSCSFGLFFLFPFFAVRSILPTPSLSVCTVSQLALGPLCHFSPFSFSATSQAASSQHLQQHRNSTAATNHSQLLPCILLALPAAAAAAACVQILSGVLVPASVVQNQQPLSFWVAQKTKSSRTKDLFASYCRRCCSTPTNKERALADSCHSDLAVPSTKAISGSAAATPLTPSLPLPPRPPRPSSSPLALLLCASLTRPPARSLLPCQHHRSCSSAQGSSRSLARLRSVCAPPSLSL